MELKRANELDWMQKGGLGTRDQLRTPGGRANLQITRV